MTRVISQQQARMAPGGKEMADAGEELVFPTRGCHYGRAVSPVLTNPSVSGKEEHVPEETPA